MQPSGGQIVNLQVKSLKAFRVCLGSKEVAWRAEIGAVSKVDFLATFGAIPPGRTTLPGFRG